jgi:hypothetical protein
VPSGYTAGGLSSIPAGQRHYPGYGVTAGDGSVEVRSPASQPSEPPQDVPYDRMGTVLLPHDTAVTANTGAGWCESRGWVRSLRSLDASQGPRSR